MMLTDNTSTASAFRGFHIIKYSDNVAYIYNYENTAMVFGTNNAERMRITSTGNVGIGTATVNAKLHVEGTTRLNGAVTLASDNWLLSTDSSVKRFYFASNDTTYIAGFAYGGNNTNVTIGFRRSNDDSTLASLLGTGTFNAVAFNSTSDSRIKKDIEDINDDEALNKILLVQPTKYNYVDMSRNKGFGKVYGFIAQQIREVIPEAITITPEIIPNIYKTCLISNKRNVYHSIPLDIAIDTEVQILETEGGKGDRYKIKEVYSDYFVIDKDIDVDEAFVYGYYINDLHSLDKNYIFTLNVCATQELHRRIETQSVVIKSYGDRITDLETKVAMLMGNTT